MLALCITFGITKVSVSFVVKVNPVEERIPDSIRFLYAFPIATILDVSFPYVYNVKFPWLSIEPCVIL